MMTIRLIYKDVVVAETKTTISDRIHSSYEYWNLIDICIDKFGLDFSQYRISDIKQSIPEAWIDFRLKEEDYIKLRNNKINKILSE